MYQPPVWLEMEKFDILCTMLQNLYSINREGVCN